MGRLPEAWIAPPATRELRHWVRHRAKLVGLRSNLKCQVHGVLAGAGVTVGMSDLFGVQGHQLLGKVALFTAERARVDSALRLVIALDFAGHCAGLRGRAVHQIDRRQVTTDPGYQAIQAITGVGPALAAVFVAEIGEVTRFPGPAQLASWAGLTSNTASPTPPCTAAGSSNNARGWSAVEAVQRIGGHTRLGQIRDRVGERRGRNIGVVAAARELIVLVFYGLPGRRAGVIARTATATP